MTSEVVSPDDFRFPGDEPLARARARKRFATALLVSGLLHAAVLAVLIGLWQREVLEEIPLPPIAVTLTEGEGAAGAAGDGSGTTAASSPSEASAATPAPQETPPAAPQAAPPTPHPVVAATPPPAEVAIEPVPRRKPTPPRPQPKAVEMAQAPAEQPQSAPTAAPTAVPGTTDTLLREGVGGHGTGDEGKGRAAYGNGSLDALGDDYLDRVRNWIARYKKYPDAALAKKQEGKAMLGFVIDRDGNVLDAWIDRSSGNALLDEATLTMVHNASPIPKVPDKYKGDTLRLFMPVDYSIGLFDRLFRPASPG